MKYTMTINPEQEIARIEKFIRSVLTKTQKRFLVVTCSGGIDSSVSTTLAVRVVGRENVFQLILPYDHLNPEGEELALSLSAFLKIPKNHVIRLNIKPIVQAFVDTLSISDIERIRLGNIMARVRMIVAYDFAKKYDALVCGTENRTEYLLGYYTRYGDQASDFEPIRHLFKTHVYEIGRYLKLPEEILLQKPTAGLWRGQTDESEFGFSYKEADPILHLFVDKNMKLSTITKYYRNSKKVVEFMQRNKFKHAVPYTIESRRY